MNIIINSLIVLQNPQIDGRIIVRELHIDDNGGQYFFDYITDKSIDINVHLADKAAELNTQFKFLYDNAISIDQAIVDGFNQKISSLQAELVIANSNLTAAQNIAVSP